MVNRFESRGMARRDAEAVVGKMAQYESFFVGLMVSEDLGMQLPDGNDAALLTDAFVMFASYAGFGALPVLVFCLGGPLGVASDHALFLAAAGASLLLLCVLGIVKSTFSSSSWISSAVESVVLGAVCCGVSYFVGFQLMSLVG